MLILHTNGINATIVPHIDGHNFRYFSFVHGILNLMISTKSQHRRIVRELICKRCLIRKFRSRSLSLSAIKVACKNVRSIIIHDAYGNGKKVSTHQMCLCMCIASKYTCVHIQAPHHTYFSFLSLYIEK